MSVADLYYFPLMAGDWLAGEAISMMTPEQEGAFVHLLCHAWQSNELPCSLPNDDRALAQLSRLGDRWATEGALVRAQFVTVGKEKTRIRNPKLWDIFREFQEKHARRVASGRTGGIAKAKGKQSSSNARPKVEQSSSSQNHNHNQKKIETAYPPDFELLWKAYPRREGANSKSAALKAYNARTREGVDFTVMQDGTARYAEFARAKAWIGTEFVMQASRFYGADKAFLEDWAVAAPNPAVIKLWAVMKTYGFASATRFTIEADLARAKLDGKLVDGEAFKRTLRKLNLIALRDVKSDDAAHRSIAESLAGEPVEGMAA